METNNIAHIIEAILFVAGEPVAIGDLAAALELSEMETMHAVEEMQKQYDADRRAWCSSVTATMCAWKPGRNTPPMWSGFCSPCSGKA